MILNEIVSPLLTLIDVAKPWIVGSPAPSTSQLLGAAPACVFSQATWLTTGAVHGAACDTAGAAPSTTNAAIRASRTAGVRGTRASSTAAFRGRAHSWTNGRSGAQLALSVHGPG